MSWTPEREEMLAKLWAEGLSCSQIATRIGGVTRNAVIGKRIRLGLPDRVGKPHMQRKARKPRKRKEQTPRSQAPVSVSQMAVNALREEPFKPGEEQVVVPQGERFSILRKNESGNVECDPRFNETSCRWPIGDPKDDDFHFCNRKKIEGLPYCEAHSRKAFQPTQVKRKKIEQSEADVAKAVAEFKRKREVA